MGFTQEEIDQMASEEGIMERYLDGRKQLLQETNGLLDDLAVSHIVASELGLHLIISQTIANLSDGMRATIYGRVISKPAKDTYTRKNGTEGVKMHFFIDDCTGKIQVIIWDERVIGEMEESNLSKNDNIKLINGNVKMNKFGKQISPDKWGRIIISPDDFPELLEETKHHKILTPIEKLEAGGIFNVRGQVITRFDIREFTRRTGSTGHVLNLIIMDNTSSIKVVLWDDAARDSSDVDQGQWLDFNNLSARQNQDILELHSTTMTTITPG